MENTKNIFGYYDKDKDKDKLFKYPSNTEILDFTQSEIGTISWCGNYIDFNKLTKLKKIIIYNGNFQYQRMIYDYAFNIFTFAHNTFYFKKSIIIN